jgi:hypothetical protein
MTIEEFEETDILAEPSTNPIRGLIWLGLLGSVILGLAVLLTGC